jgi:hypothetical protein
MKRLPFFVMLLSIFTLLEAEPVAPSRADAVAAIQLGRMGTVNLMGVREPLGNLAFLYELEPAGYIVVCADDALPPVLAYSATSSFYGPEGNLLKDLVLADLDARLRWLAPSAREENRLRWQSFSSIRDPFQQWPPEGSTATGGWIKTQWTQSAPYNALCPLDPVTGNRSIAGCPAVAMAQIVNYHRTINGTLFNDADDYHHNYAGRNYWIDDDAAAQDFPTWPELNDHLATMMHHYKYQEDQTDTDMAALVWACGAAAHQVYTSQASGTFAVSQAFTAYQRFDFPESELLTGTAPDLYDRMAQNMINALPVHLAVVTPAWDAGHNVVVDGYNTDNYFHLNFGWGGSYSGWYLLPSEIPYNLTVIEGAIVDIHPRSYLFPMPGTLDFTDPQTVFEPQQLELVNITDANVTIEAIIPENPVYQGNSCMVELTHPDLPLVLTSGQSLYVTVQLDFPVDLGRDPVQGALRVIHGAGVLSIPILVDSTMFVPADDPVVPVQSGFSLYPSPFVNGLTIKSKATGPFRVSVYNLRGQQVAELEGRESITWDGRDFGGAPVSSGIYLVRMEAEGISAWRKVLRLK